MRQAGTVATDWLVLLPDGEEAPPPQDEGEMALPMKTASGENVATEQRLASLDSKLNGLGASLLETGAATATRTRSATARTAAATRPA